MNGCPQLPRVSSRAAPRSESPALSSPSSEDRPGQRACAVASAPSLAAGHGQCPAGGGLTHPGVSERGCWRAGRHLRVDLRVSGQNAPFSTALPLCEQGAPNSHTSGGALKPRFQTSSGAQSKLCGGPTTAPFPELEDVGREHPAGPGSAGRTKLKTLNTSSCLCLGL